MAKSIRIAKRSARRGFGYSRYLRVIEKMLERMYIGDPPGACDRLLDFSTPHTGTTFFATTRSTLQMLVQTVPRQAAVGGSG